MPPRIWLPARTSAAYARSASKLIRATSAYVSGGSSRPAAAYPIAACAIRTRPSSHGPPPKPPSTGIDTDRATSAPTTGPELVKSSSAAPASSSALASATSRSAISAGSCAPGRAIAA